MATITIPEQFLPEYKRASKDELDDLYSSTRVLLTRGLTISEVVPKLAEAGWSSEFAMWYATVSESNRSHLILTPYAKLETEPGTGWQRDWWAVAIGVAFVVAIRFGLSNATLLPIPIGAIACLGYWRWRNR